MQGQTAQNGMKYVDLDEGLGRVRGNKKIYRRMLGLFLASEEFPALEAALAAQDYAKAAEVAHGIKGMTGNLSLAALYDVSTRLMGQLRAGAPEGETLAEYRDTLAATRAAAEEAGTQLDAELA